MRLRASILCVLVILLNSLSLGRAQGQPPDILIIHSYHKGYAWTDEQSAGLESALRDRFPEAVLDVFYLDWKRHPTARNLENSAAVLRARYQGRGRGVSVIATTDDAALKFALEIRPSLFPDTPIIHGGVLEKDARGIIGSRTNVTGVRQTMDPLGTLELAKAVNGPYRKAVFIRDETESSVEFERDLRSAAARMDPPVEIVTLSGLPFGELLEHVGRVPEEEVLLLGSYASDSLGTTLPLTSFVERITAASSVPVYGFYMNQLHHGIVGGSLLSGAESGRLQAGLITEVRNGLSADSFPSLSRETTERILDHDVLNKWGMSTMSPAADVRFVNTPLDPWQKYKMALLVTAAVILALTLVAALLILNILQRRKAQVALESTVQDLRESRKNIQQTEERYRLAAQAGRDIVWEWDIKSGKRIYSDQLRDLLGLTPEDVPSAHAWHQRIHPDDQAEVLPSLQEFMSGTGTQHRFEYRIRNSEDNYVWLEANTLLKRDDKGEPCLIVGRYTDITEIKQGRKELDYLAYHDPLTGLPNREFLRRHVTRLTHAAAPNRFALIFIDLDNFKLVNDSSGHLVGDEVLRQATARIQDIMGGDRVVARLGGDEFVIVLGGGDLSILDELGDRVTRAFQIPFTVDGQKFHLGCSAGVAVYPVDGTDFDALLRNADTAMYNAKEQGKGTLSRYQAHMSKTAIDRIHFHNRLRDAVDHGHFIVHYQPQVLAKDGRLRGAEALLRWNDPEHGLIGPDRFIPACEESGLIVDIGEWVLKSACEALTRFDKEGRGELSMGINVSVVQLMQSDFVPKVIDIVERARIDPKRLELEITESTVMGAFDDCRRRLKILRDVGFQTGLDDFGVGYSSLTYLRLLPFSTLKLDKSFIDGLPQNPRDSAMVRSIIQIAGDLGLDTVAEGVEHLDQRDVLAGTTCTWIQGYLVGRPMPETDFLTFTRDWSGFDQAAARPDA